MDELEARIEALERAVTDGDGDGDLSAFASDAAALDRLAAVESTCESLETQVNELEAATQALRGYVGNIRSVNREVEKRADSALAAVEELEAELGRVNDNSSVQSNGSSHPERTVRAGGTGNRTHGGDSSQTDTPPEDGTTGLGLHDPDFETLSVQERDLDSLGVRQNGTTQTENTTGTGRCEEPAGTLERIRKLL